MHAARPRLLQALAALGAAAALAGCGKTSSEAPSAAGAVRTVAPVAAQGAVSVVTRNTTRLGGADAASDAAAVARVVYPSLDAASRPQAVVLVDEHDWPAALAASVLAGAPLNAPILYAEGDSLPEVSRQTLEALHPLGAASLGGAQVIRIGTAAAVPAGYATRDLPRASAPAAAAAIEQLLSAVVRWGAPHQAIVLPAQGAPALEMPAAGLAAQSGAPVLFAGAALPGVTAAALQALHRPSIYVIDSAQLGAAAVNELRHLGHVSEISPPVGEDSSPAASAIAVARFTDGSFGWGVKEPGHGLVIADSGRPLDAPAAAPLSASADYGPLLTLEAPTRIPPALSAYLADIQPAYTSAFAYRPVRGVYNHGWLIGDELAISGVVQAEIDSLLEISPRKPSEEPSVSQAE